MEDARIIDLFLARDEDAIVQTSEKYGKSLRRIAENILQNESDAEECENDTYAEAWNRIPPNEPRTYFFAYLSRITRYLALGRCREMGAAKRQAYYVELSGELAECIPSPDDVESYIDERELGRLIGEFLKTQSGERANIFVRRYFYMDSVSVIAKRFGLSGSKVKTTLFRMRNDLKLYLEREGYLI